MSTRSCQVADCTRPHYAKGLCNAHWNRQRRGKPLDGPFRKAAKSPMQYVPRGLAESECWPWMGAVSDSGYGRWSNAMAHRLVYEALVGPIPEGLVIDHLCRNRACVNPGHLEPVTIRVNSLRGEAPTVVMWREDECGKGHPLTPANVYIRPDTQTRQCRTCMYARNAAWAKRQRQERVA